MVYALPMKIWEELSGASQKEALLNEVKGNLFEYLVAAKIARKYGDEGHFLNDFEDHDHGKAKDELVHYQKWLIENDAVLYRRLPELAESVVNHLEKTKYIKKETRVKRVQILGKRKGEHLKHFHEADVVLFLDHDKELPISLKLCKKGAFVNTKSGGIRTFIEKYFFEFDEAKEAQKRLCAELDKSFSTLANSFYEWADIRIEDDSLSKLHFSPQWEERGLPTLPGELNDTLKPLLHDHYNNVIKCLYHEIKGFFEKDKKLFLKSLGPLVGLGDEGILQVSCFYNHKEERYSLDQIKTFSYTSFGKELDAIELLRPGIGLSSFQLNLEKHEIQIRVKPMNKFTVSGLKVNCSLRGKLKEKS